VGGGPGERELALRVSGLQGLEELCLEEDPEDVHAEEIFARRCDPSPLAKVEPAASDHAVEVGMRLELLAPGMENRREADLGAEVLLLAGDLLERLCRALEQEVEDDLLVSERQGIQLVRERENDVKVGDGKQALLPRLEPLVFFQALAFWTMPVPAGVIRDPHVAAVCASVLVPAKGCGTALLDVPEDLPLPGRRIVEAAVLISVGTQDVRYLQVSAS
jgi:hypothetical protein